jgi:hypothetical protein
MSRDHPASKHRIEQVLGDFEKMTTVGRSQNGLTSTIHVRGQQWPSGNRQYLV